MLDITTKVLVNVFVMMMIMVRMTRGSGRHWTLLSRSRNARSG